MKKYRVHLYLEVRYPVEVEADSPKEAAKKAVNQDLYNLCLHNQEEYAEDIIGILVDLIDSEGKWKEKSWDFTVDEILDEEPVYPQSPVVGSPESR